MSSSSPRRASRLREVRTPADVLLLVHIAGVAALVPLLMRVPLERLRRLLEPAPPSHAADPRTERHLLALIDLVLDVSRPALRPDCRARGLTRYYFLRRAGVDVALAFGVGWPSGVVAGHCWLVKNGLPYLEARDPRPVFAEVYRLQGPLRDRACAD